MSLRNLAKLISEANKEKTPEQEFLAIYNETIKRSQKPKTPSRTYKPSSLGGCMRRMYYEVTGAPIDENITMDPNLVEIMESGTDRHQRIQQTIIKAQELGYDIEWVDVEEYLDKWPQPGTRVIEKVGMETKLKNDILNLSFMCDGIIKLKGEYYILEIKTEASFKWNGRVSPVERHQVQAIAYATALGINKVLFVYENRDFCSKKAFVMNVTEQMKEEKVIHKIETCNAYIENGIVPPCTCTQSERNYCPYTTQCEKDGETKQEDIEKVEGRKKSETGRCIR